MPRECDNCLHTKHRQSIKPLLLFVWANTTFALETVPMGLHGRYPVLMLGKIGNLIPVFSHSNNSVNLYLNLYHQHVCNFKPKTTDFSSVLSSIHWSNVYPYCNAKNSALLKAIFYIKYSHCYTEKKNSYSHNC